MIPDSITNTLYLADCLPNKYPEFYEKFESLLGRCNISFQLLPKTRDIWAVDYMPIQVSEKKFVQFVYDPDYLEGKVWSKTISNVDHNCDLINLTRIKSNIILDGGNVSKTTDKVIMCDKIFQDNLNYSRNDLIKNLKDIFEIDYLYLIPQQPKDIIGHSDGMVRFLDDNTVLINDLSREKEEFRRSLRISLDNADLEYIEIPYNPYANKSILHANGEYINYLQMENLIVIPTFGMPEDDIVIKQFEDLFKGYQIESIECNELAKNGGILNCITWNIFQN